MRVGVEIVNYHENNVTMWGGKPSFFAFHFWLKCDRDIFSRDY